MYRILLADDNITLRSALALLLETRLHAQIVAQVTTMNGLLSEAGSTQPDIVIMDWELSGELAQNSIAALRKLSPLSRIIVTSARPEVSAAANQADGFLCKTDPPEAVIELIQTQASTLHEKDNE